MEKKHAFLIMAHTNPEQLKKLLILLDHPRVDIFLHIDRNASFSPERFCSCTQFSRIIPVPRRRVNWGGRSQIECELSLIQCALPGEYAHYHLLSGMDLPLKKIAEILAFFDANPEKEFVHLDSRLPADGVRERFSLYWLLQEKERKCGVYFRLQNLWITLQKRIGVDRTKKDQILFYKGANWFSCTHTFLSALIREKENILTRFSNTRCCDEIFLQTFLMNSPFQNCLFAPPGEDRANMRLIDWERGAPYVFREEDVPALLSSEFLFARKFDERISPSAIDRIFQALR